MDKDDTGTGGISEAELLSLLAAMKVEPAPEADFEGRFLYDLRERLARESVCCPARRLLWDHVVQMLINFGPRKIACGASTLGLGALAVGLLALPEEPTSAPVAAARNTLTRLEHSLAALRPNSGHEAKACTTIRVAEPKKAPYTEASLASGDFFAAFDNGLAPSSVETIPVNMGLDAPARSVFPSFSTSVGF